MLENRSKAIGIDLGTTTSIVSVWNYTTDKIEVLKNEQNETLIQSTAYFDNSNPNYWVGTEALKKGIGKQTIYDSKRVIGKKFNEITINKNWTFDYKQDKDGSFIFCVQHNKQEKIFRPEEISSLVLSELKRIAEKSLGHEVTKCVITCIKKN